MHIRLYDMNSVGYTHHHGQSLTTDSLGRQTQAVSGVLNRIKQQIKQSPEILPIALWDGRAQWRYDLHPSYKSGRHRTPEQRAAREAYTNQVPWIQKGLSCFPVVQVTHPNAEADDLGWALSRQLERQGHLVTLESSDTDWLQMVSQRVECMSARSPHTLIGLDGFLANSKGFPHPLLVPHIKAISGDSSDDIEGVEKIADKRAIVLIDKYQSVENLISATEDFMSFSQEPSWAHALMDPQVQQRILNNLRLIDLSRGPALKGADCVVTCGEGDERELQGLLESLALNSLTQGYYSWQQVCDSVVTAAGRSVVQKALSNLHESWGE